MPHPTRKPQPATIKLPPSPAAREITADDVTRAMALEKAQVFHAIYLAIHRAAQQYGKAEARQQVLEALYLEFGSEVVL
jgi:hypothetical protein